MDIPIKRPFPHSNMTPREFVDALDELINLRVREASLSPVLGKTKDDAEIILRAMTDYLIQSSAESGVYQTGAK